MARINWTREAEYWLKDIYDYISEDNPRAATKVVEEIYNRAQDLTRFPEIGYRYEVVSDRDIRILLYGHYRIAYLVRPEGDIDHLRRFSRCLGSFKVPRLVIKSSP